MESAREYELTREGLPINPHNGALPPRGVRIDNYGVKIATGCDARKGTAASLCLRKVEALEDGILRMIEECSGLAALVICLVTPVIGPSGAKIPSWKDTQLEYGKLLAAVGNNDCDLTAAEIREVFRNKDVIGLIAKAMHQVFRWIKAPGQEDVDDPLSGTSLQFSHYYFGMKDWQMYVVFRLFCLIKKDLNRYEGAQWLDWERPASRPQTTKKFKYYSQLQAALTSFAQSMFPSLLLNRAMLTAYRRRYISRSCRFTIYYSSSCAPYTGRTRQHTQD